MNGLLGKKIGMTRIFSETGEDIPVTVLQVGPCYVTGLCNNESAGYDAVQLAFEEIPQRKVNKPVLGQFKKNNLNTYRYLKEFRSTTDQLSKYNIGDELKVDFFAEGELVKVTATSKGKGFQGTVKRHGFRGGPKSHGQSDRLRAPGSLGQSSYPSRVFKGIKMSGRMGNERVTVKNLRVVRIDVENNILMINGAVPGAKNSLVQISR